ncbi:MAG TPA: filamentous hemagglutinin N-terminal domain-containing protein, partial [Geobacteraceae bacterium]
MMKKTIAITAAINMAVGSSVSLAAYSIPGYYGQVTLPKVGAATLPDVRDAVGATVSDPLIGQLIVKQNQPNAIINWKSFNIGANAVVYFQQKNASGVPQPTWTALNRIYDSNPSQIFGQIKADGKVYLINQNGILFGPGSQVNVHTLIASTLDLKVANQDFLNGNGLFQFKAQNYQKLPKAIYDINKLSATVSNHGIIATDSGGSVYLLASTVENNGNINAPFGQVYLLAAQPASVSTAYDVDVTSLTPYQAGVSGGKVFNYQDGALSSDSGQVKLYGSAIDQEGTIRAGSAVNQNGLIELHASGLIFTGRSSLIYSPISGSSETMVADPSHPYTGGIIAFGGLGTITGTTANTTAAFIDLGGKVVAPFGNVKLNAVNRVYLDSGASIDVSGLWVDKAAGSNLIDVQMNSINLRDDYGQKTGALKGETVAVNPLCGSK